MGKPIKFFTRSVNLVYLVIVLVSCKQQNNSKLEELFIQDQKDRLENNINLTLADKERLKEVKLMLQNNVLHTAKDFFHAAVILQHGTDSLDYKLANKLASNSVELNPTDKKAKILIAQTKDRHLLSLGKPQIYGTQRRVIGNKEFLLKIDTSLIKDKDREAMGLPTISELLEYLAKENKQKSKDLKDFILTDSIVKLQNSIRKADLIGSFKSLVSKIQYPEEALVNKVTGKVLVEYTITPEGTTKDIVIAEGLGFGCDEEAKRIISNEKFINYVGKDIRRRTRLPFNKKLN